MKNYFKTFYNRYIPKLINKSDNTFMYGKDNLLPNNIIKYINESGVAKNCVKTIAQFIQADGFNNEVAAALGDKLLKDVATQFAYFGGYAVYVYRKSDGTIDKGRFNIAPFESIRVREDGNYDVNINYGNQYFKKIETKIYPKFYGNQISVDSLITQLDEFEKRPEIYYSYIKSPDNPNYPVPDFFAGIEDIITSSELAKFDLSTVKNGFITSAILTIIGEIDDEKRGIDGLTDLERLEQQLGNFTGENKDSDGTSGQNRLLLMFAATKDAMPVLQPFDAKAIYDASNTKRDLIERAVCRLFGVHPVLMGYSDAATLGNQQALANAVALINYKLNPVQRHISEDFEMLFGSEIDWTISTFQPYQYISPEVFAVLTTDEKRAIGGFSPLEIKENDTTNQ